MTKMFNLYKAFMQLGEPVLNAFLTRRLKRGKENADRLGERRGVTDLKRPDGPLGWVHAASVGEAQSALILINRLLERHKDLHILLTTGTISSAALMAKKLPERAFHQLYPLDHPAWAARFLDHWRPDFVLWMESELWPCMLSEVGKRKIPAALVNARLSPTSLGKWHFARPLARDLLAPFQSILCQTDIDAASFRQLGAEQNRVHVTDNIKYSAAPLPASEKELETLKTAIGDRPCWVYASTHKGEETLAARVHSALKSNLPGLLTIIVPRHPERRNEIAAALDDAGLNVQFRGDDHAAPLASTDIYIADTFGELGLFYRAAPMACIGRSFSDDGGGGHNPIEAAQLDCAVLHGPNIQNLQEIFDQMDSAGAARKTPDENALSRELLTLLSRPEKLSEFRTIARNFAGQKESVIDRVLAHLSPMLGTIPALDERFGPRS